MSNAQPQALEAKLSTFTSLCRKVLEDRGLAITGKDNKDRKHLGDIDPETFIALRKKAGIEMVDGTPT